MRNDVYTVYQGDEFVLSRDLNSKYILLFNGKQAPSSLFYQMSSFDEKGMALFARVVENDSEITNAYYVKVWALYKTISFQVDKKSNDSYQLVTDKEDVANEYGFEFVDRGYFLKYVHRSEIERMWEIRSKSNYDLPMPEGLNEIEDIDF